MNRNTHDREKFSLNQKRFRAIATGQFVTTIKILMLITAIFRFNCVKGFSLGLSLSKCSSIFRQSVCSITTSSTPMGFSFQTSRPLAMSRSTSSTSIESHTEDKAHHLSLSIPTMEVMEEVGALIAILSQETDVLFLDGDLGAGKTTFSRGFIKCKLGIADDASESENDGVDGFEPTADARVEQASLRITSPTYLLSNTYEYRDDDDDGTIGEQIREIHHMDLYRLSGKSPRDFDPLDLGHVFSSCISLIEWPSRLQAFPQLLPPEETLLNIDIRIPDPTLDERVMSLTSSSESSWTTRLKYLIDEGMVDDLLLPTYDESGNDTDCED